MDPRNFSCNVICNNCLFGLSSFTQNNLYSTAVYPSTQPSTQTIKKQTVKKTTNTNQEIHSSTVPVSSWSVVPIAKAHMQKNVYTARIAEKIQAQSDDNKELVLQLENIIKEFG